MLMKKASNIIIPAKDAKYKTKQILKKLEPFPPQIYSEPNNVYYC